MPPVRGVTDARVTEALAGARDGADREAKELLVSEARERLREALRDLLGW